jgi:hypothetical protein
MTAKNESLKIDQLEQELKRLEQCSLDRKGSIEELELEQRTYVVAARVRNDVEAQRNLDRISGEISKLRSEEHLDHIAISEITATIGSLHAGMEADAWKARCKATSDLVRPRVGGAGEARAVKLALALKRELLQLRTSDEDIFASLRGLGLTALAQNIRRSCTRRPEMIAGLLIPELETPLSGAYLSAIGKDPQAAAVQAYATALKGVEDLLNAELKADASTEVAQATGTSGD